MPAKGVEGSSPDHGPPVYRSHPPIESLIRRGQRSTFVHTASGFVTAPPSMAGPEAGVGTDTFDGNGGSTLTATLSINGNIAQVTATGTYKVKPDCTGTYKISAPGGTTTLFIVIGDNGNEIQAICVDSGVVLTHVFRRQFPVGDWRE